MVCSGRALTTCTAARPRATPYCFRYPSTSRAIFSNTTHFGVGSVTANRVGRYESFAHARGVSTSFARKAVAGLCRRDSLCKKDLIVSKASNASGFVTREFINVPVTMSIVSLAVRDGINTTYTRTRAVPVWFANPTSLLRPRRARRAAGPAISGLSPSLSVGNGAFAHALVV